MMRIFRKKLFWLLDRIQQQGKAINYKDVKDIIENPNSNKVKEKKKTYLKNILKHAVNTTTFYSNYKKYNSINDFPVINKNIIRNNFSQFEASSYKKKKKKTVSTSGSTGAPFKVYQNAQKTIRNTADNLYFSKKSNYELGNKLYYFRLWKAFESKKIYTKFIQNIVPIDVFDLNNEYIKKLIFKLKKNKSQKSWIGYASAFEKICKYLDKNNVKPFDCNLKSVIAISESLNPYTKYSIKKYFGVDALSRYSNVENGILAQQIIGKPYFLINQASYYVEILDFNNDTPVEEGRKGRIVITDLFNYCIPMIRYDTGDVGTIETIDSNLVLTKIEGRKIDLITNTKGKIISNNLILLVNNYHELNQCQLIQKTKNSYLFKINIDGEFKNQDKFINEFKSHLGNDAIINIEYVNEIPLLASGKRRVMVNETLVNK